MAKSKTTPKTLLTNSAIWTPVEDYNAVGDGSTDDTQAIQDAIDSGKLVSLSPNTIYLIESSLEIEWGESLYIPPTSTLKFDAEGESDCAIIMNSHGTLAGNGNIQSSRYDYNYNDWNTNDKKSAIKIIGEGVKIEIGFINGF